MGKNRNVIGSDWEISLYLAWTRARAQARPHADRGKVKVDVDCNVIQQGVR